MLFFLSLGVLIEAKLVDKISMKKKKEKNLYQEKEKNSPSYWSLQKFLCRGKMKGKDVVPYSAARENVVNKINVFSWPDFN